MKRKIIYFLSAILMIALCLSFTACDDDNVPSEITDAYFKNINMPLVYEIYLDYMEEIGETPLTYEEWFEVINGDEFQKGIIPEIRKNDMTDFWEISYNNGKGWNDLRFKTETEEQKNCKHTFDKWITLCEANDYFNGIRYRSCKYCNYKDYQFKLNDNVCLHLELETISGKPATCTEEGLTDGKKCTRCNELIVDQLTLNKLDHTFDDQYDASCNDCGHIRETTCSHPELETIPGKSATCVTMGLTDGKKCTKCGEIIIEQTIIPPTEVHIFELGICINCSIGYYSQGLEFSLNEDGQSYSVIGIGTCIDSEVIIPSLYEGLPVTKINENAFSNCNSIISIIVSNSVVTIEKYAIHYCSKLTTVKIPSSVMYIGEYFLRNCSNVNYITVDSENSNYKSVNGHLYTKDGTVLMKYATAQANATFTIPDGVIKIDKAAFQNSQNLTSITLPDGILVLDEMAFMKCTALTQINLPYGLTTIERSAFNSCSSIEHITIPETVTTIGYATFYSCSSLKEMIIPNGIEILDRSMFNNCFSLETLTLPSSIKSLGNWFIQSNVLSAINFNGTIEQWEAISKGTDWNSSNSNYIIRCSDGTIAKDGTVTYN